MTAGLLLDGLLFLVVAFYVPIGAWRGGIREALLGGAILLGAASAIAWAPAWGDDIAELVGWSSATGRFLVAAGMLATVGGGLGYGAGAVAGRRRPSGLESRAAGGALALINALLLLSFLLSFLTTYLNEGRTIRTVEAGWFADALVERQGWLLLIACAVGAGVAVVGRIAARFDEDLVEREAGGERGTALGPRRRLAVAPPADPDGGKVDPATGLPEGIATARWSDRTLRGSTRPIVPLELTSPDRAFDAAAASEVGNGRGALGPKPPAPVGGFVPREGPTVVDSWLRRAAELTPPDSQAPASRETRDRASFPFTDAALRNLLDPAQDRGRAVLPRVDPLAGLVPPVEPASTPAPKSERRPGAALDPVRRCAVCGTPAATDLRECPFCGATLSSAKEG